MYICVSCTGGLKAGDIMILEKNDEFGEVAARMIGGGIVGFVTDKQPEGCLGKYFVEKTIGRKRLIGRVAIRNGNVALFQSDSALVGDDDRFLASRRAAYRR